jgi:transposase-like protein
MYHRCKLTKDQREQILQMKRDGKYSTVQIAAKFGVTQGFVSGILWTDRGLQSRQMILRKEELAEHQVITELRKALAKLRQARNKKETV